MAPLPLQPARPQLVTLQLAGLDGAIILTDDADLLGAVQRCLLGWPLTLSPLPPTKAPPPRPLTVVEPRSPGRYRAHSRYTDAPVDQLPLAAAVCAVLADISQAYSDAPGDHAFGLHCGAVTLQGRTLILCGAHRAGKSTLVARLSAEPGVAIFSDDVTPIGADGRVLALGIAPRLRLPLPATASGRFREHVARSLGPADQRYGYLLPPGLLPHGATARAEALILLDRRDAGPAALHALPPEAVLRLILERSIARPDGPEQVFAAAQALAGGLQGLRLVYADLEEAVALLQRAFGEGVQVLPPLAEGAASAETDAGAQGLDQVFARSPDTVLRRVGAAACLWQPGGAVLWHLNPVALAIWGLLEVPGAASDLAEMLAEVFPDEPQPRLLADVGRLLAEFCSAGLIAPIGN